ncbi:MAG: glycosyltransferase family 4 protein, partial [Candidatus Paceibacterota bacterium]
MKILLCTGIFIPEPGGPANYTLKLATLLKQAGHSPRVLCYSDEESYVGDQTLSFPVDRVKRTTSKLKNYKHYYRRAKAHIKEVDVVYSLDWFSAGIPLAFACKRAGKSYALRVGGGYIWEKYLSQGKKPMSLEQFYKKGAYKKYPLMKLLMGYVFKNAKRIAFNSEKQKNFFQEAYKLSEEKLLVIENPIPNVSAAEEAKRGKTIIFAGRFNAKNNVSLLIDAFESVAEKGFTLVLIGEGPEKAKLLKQAEDKPYASKIFFKKTLTQEDLFDQLSTCYLAVLPSWTDISPNFANECRALKAPFIISKENYLPYASQIPNQFDPASAEELKALLLKLADEGEYQ